MPNKLVNVPQGLNERIDRYNLHGDLHSIRKLFLDNFHLNDSRLSDLFVTLSHFEIKRNGSVPKHALLPTSIFAPTLTERKRNEELC